ncbi:MAG: Hsp20/alpha crystallin family protein [Saprospiraceae bacterium]|nr:Hsp20/alpha crystallin family protein [Saprospiraceae bacterium]
MLPVKKENGFRLMPFGENWMDRFMNMDRFFGDDLSRFSWMPAVNIRETDDKFFIEVAAPGLKKNDFKVTVEKNVLNIQTELEEKDEEMNENFTRKEFSYRSFSRSFVLPEYVDPENITARYDDGILRLSLKKKVEMKPKPRQIKVG